MRISSPRPSSVIFSIACIVIFYSEIIGIVHCDWLMQCESCRCKWNSGKKTADCKNMSLTGVPKYLSSELQVLDLSFNRLPYINEEVFYKADLQNLHKLFIRNSTLDKLHPKSLKGLEILIELDISNNLIKTLPRDLFTYLVKVRSLIINCNLLETLESGLFRNLQYLHKVELKDNRLIAISAESFLNVPLLSQIFLNGNRLRHLRKEIFEKLKRLTSLSLDSNPWNCTCELQSFRDFTIKRNLYTPPTACYYPAKLRGTLWTDNTPEAFACKPKIIYPSRGASINTSKENVTLICRVHASPNTLIAWDYNKQIYSSSYQARVNIQLLREENPPKDEREIGRDIFISRLTIIGAEKSDEGVYTCLAENAGGKDEVQMNLLVQKHNHQNILLQNNIVIIICLMVLGLLSASIFLAMITCFIYKRLKIMNQQHHHNSSTVDSEQTLHHNENKRNFTGIHVSNSSDITSGTTGTATSGYHSHTQEQNILNHQNISQIVLNRNGCIGGGKISNQNSNIKKNENETDYVEVKQAKVISPITDVGNVINNFTDLKTSSRSFNETSKMDSRQGQIAQANCSTTLQTEPRTIDYSGEYQPDLLPFMPQSISFNNTPFYSYDNTGLNHLPTSPYPERKHYSGLDGNLTYEQESEQYHETQSSSNHHPPQNHLQMTTELEYHADRKDITLHSNALSETRYMEQQQRDDEEDEYDVNNDEQLQYISRDPVPSPTPADRMTTYTTNTMTLTGNGGILMGKQHHQSYQEALFRRIIDNDCLELTHSPGRNKEEIYLTRQTAFKTSPSLNILTNQQRRELL